MDYSSAYPWAKKKLLKETSIFTTYLKIRELRESKALRKKDENLVKVVVCREDESICSDESLDPDRPFYFFYATFFTKVLLRLPLSIYEKELLTELNVASAQLHPNNWAFIRGFIILCSQLGILPTMEVFFYFFEFKQSSWQLWASFNGVSGRGLLTLFQSSYKKFKGQFIKVHALVGDSSLLDGFPLYWSSHPRFQSARQLEDLFPRERGICEFMENLKVVFDTPTLLTKEYLPSFLKAYIGIPFFQPQLLKDLSIHEF